MTAGAPIAGHRGFTLVELLVVVILLGVVGSITTGLLIKPIEGYVALARRAELVDAADTALRRMARDIRRALPNSVRVGGGGTVLELLHTVDGGRYRARPGGGPSDILDFSMADGGFDVIGELQNFAAIPAGARAVVYNVSGTGASNNAYAGDNAAPIDLAGSLPTYVALNPAHQFPARSPQQRFFLVDEAVSFLCDPGAGTLTRYAGYGFDNTLTTDPTSAKLAGSGAILARHVAACRFSYSAGQSERAGLVTLQLELLADGESVRLLHQVHVDNVP